MITSWDWPCEIIPAPWHSWRNTWCLNIDCPSVRHPHAGPATKMSFIPNLGCYCQSEINYHYICRERSSILLWVGHGWIISSDPSPFYFMLSWSWDITGEVCVSSGNFRADVWLRKPAWTTYVKYNILAKKLIVGREIKLWTNSLLYWLNIYGIWQESLPY